MSFGISVYPGLDNTPEENIDLIRRAAQQGVSRLFTSLHIPENDRSRFSAELRDLIDVARKLQLDVIADVTPESAAILGLTSCTLEAFQNIGIQTFRLDDGFDVSAIASFTRNAANIRIQLNASTVSEEFLAELSNKNADFSCIDALHNFYPRQNTGLSVRAFSERTALLHRFGIRTGAFVATQNGRKRSPLYDGLPTLELHRGFSVDLAARHLAALGIDDIFLSDALPTEAELTAFTKTTLDCVTLHAVPAIESETLSLLAEPFTSRPDEARDAVRTVESRARSKQLTLPLVPENTCQRPFGSVTLDNIDYLRYAGELQITKRNLPADPRVNVLAHIHEEELFLLSCIHPGSKFRILLDH